MKPKDAFGRYGCVPRDMHPAWQQVSYLARAVGRDLLSTVDDFETLSVPVSGDWKSSICLRLCVNGGNDRRNAKRALDELLEAGLIEVDGARVAVRMSPACARNALAMSPDVRRGVVSSTQVPEKTQIQEPQQASKQSQQSEQRAPAPARSIASRPDVIGFTFVASLLGRDVTRIAPVNSYPSDYSWIGSKSPAERGLVAEAVNADEWCLANPGHVDAPHLVKGWQKYLGGRVKPIARAVEKPKPTGVWAKAGAQ